MLLAQVKFRPFAGLKQNSKVNNQVRAQYSASKSRGDEQNEKSGGCNEKKVTLRQGGGSKGNSDTSKCRQVMWQFQGKASLKP